MLGLIIIIFFVSLFCYLIAFLKFRVNLLLNLIRNLFLGIGHSLFLSFRCHLFLRGKRRRIRVGFANNIPPNCEMQAFVGEIIILLLLRLLENIFADPRTLWNKINDVFQRRRHFSLRCGRKFSVRLDSGSSDCSIGSR